MESARRGRIILLDATNLSHRRILSGGAHRISPVWSPDSRYPLRSQRHLRCGIGIDVDPPFTLEIIDVQSGNRAKVQSS